MLNEFLTPVTIQMDTLVKVKSVAERSMFATSLDLSDAYHHIPMRKDSHVYLCFQVKDKRYMYLVLPFGLNDCAMGVHTSSEASEDLVIAPSPGTVPISRRLAQSLQISSASKDMDGSPSETLRAIRITGKSGKVGAPAYAIDRVPRRETRPGPRPGLPDGRTPASRRSGGGTSDSSARSQVCSGGIAAGTNVSDCTHDFSRVNAYATVPARGHSSSACRKKRKRVDSSDRPVSKGTGIVDSHSTLANRGSIPDCSPSGSSVHRRLHHGVGVAFQGKMWSGVWQRPNHHINWLELRAVLVAV